MLLVAQLNLVRRSLSLSTSPSPPRPPHLPTFPLPYPSPSISLTSSVSELMRRIRLTLKIVSEERVMAPPGLSLRPDSARPPEKQTLPVPMPVNNLWGLSSEDSIVIHPKWSE